MTFDVIELVIAAAILLFFAYVIFRGGSANPVGTGQLQKQLNTIGGEVLQLKGQVDACASNAEIEALRSELHAMEQHVASSGEVIAIQGQISTLGAKVDGIARAADRTEDAVQRIEGHFLRRGIDRD